jgi:phosphonate degradation associated HDIG domain protein
VKAGSAHATCVDEVIELYARWGSDRYDEDVTQLDHAVQTAAHAVAAGAADELVVAALLHDVGHLLDLRDGGMAPEASAGDRRHEEVGAAFLRPLFLPTVTAAIALHVRAKRYLSAVDLGYSDRLSAGSRRSLRRQGGAMTPDEVAGFEATAGFADAVRLRRWDDAGKDADTTVLPFERYTSLLRRLSTLG